MRDFRAGKVFRPGGCAQGGEESHNFEVLLQCERVVESRFVVLRQVLHDDVGNLVHPAVAADEEARVVVFRDAVLGDQES